MRRQRSDSSADRFSTATRLRALGSEAAERVYRSQARRVRGPRRSRLTGRAALLALVVCSLVVALAYPMRQYVSQRMQIADQLDKAGQAQKRVQELRERKARWKDPAYVEQQARERLHYLRPGETGYLVADGSSGHADATRPPDSASAQDRPWYGTLWRSVDKADKADKAGGAGDARAAGEPVGSR